MESLALLAAAALIRTPMVRQCPAAAAPRPSK